MLVPYIIVAYIILRSFLGIRPTLLGVAIAIMIYRIHRNLEILR